jgi:hypothetical protein
MATKTRAQDKPNDTFELARWFVETCLHQTWGQNGTKLYGRHLADAGALLSRYEPVDIKACLQEMQATRPLRWGSLRIVLDLDPETGQPYINRYASLQPPRVDSVDYDEWVRRRGAKALKAGAWDGVYRRWDGREFFPDGRGGALTLSELEGIVGPELAEKAVGELIQMIISRREGHSAVQRWLDEQRQNAKRGWI